MQKTSRELFSYGFRGGIYAGLNVSELSNLSLLYAGGSDPPLDGSVDCCGCRVASLACGLMQFERGLALSAPAGAPDASAVVPIQLGGIPGSKAVGVLGEPVAETRLPGWRAVRNQQVCHQSPEFVFR